MKKNEGLTCRQAGLAYQQAGLAYQQAGLAYQQAGLAYQQAGLACRQAGFSLIELLVVIFIIGILASLLAANLVGTRNRAQDSQAKTSLQDLKKALRIYYNDYQSYPDDDGSGNIAGCGTSGDQTCTNTFSNGDTTIYMKELPANFSYYSDGSEEFLLTVELYNVSDQDISNNQTTCNPDSRIYFTNDPIDTNEYVVCEN